MSNDDRENRERRDIPKPRNDEKSTPQQTPDYSSIIKKSENEPPSKREKE